MTPDVTILTSGLALGVYTPALIVARRLESLGLSVSFEVLENLLPDDKRARIPEAKVAFHRNFRAARIGQKMAGRILESLEPGAVSDRIIRWRDERRSRFLVFSGFWIPMLERLLESPADDLRIDLCYMDSSLSPSWLEHPVSDSPAIRETWFFRAETGKLVQRLRIGDDPPVPWKDRRPRAFAHGGGWGMGTYRDHIDGILETGLQLDLVAYEEADIDPAAGDAVRYFMIDPAWNGWQRGPDGEHGFPPFGRVEDGGPAYQVHHPHHGAFEVTRRNRWIVSKPGGGTLLDSLASATPIVFLDPLGAHEQHNAGLWSRLGLGVPFADWLAAPDRNALGEELHRNLLRFRMSLPEFVNCWYEDVSNRPMTHARHPARDRDPP